MDTAEEEALQGIVMYGMKVNAAKEIIAFFINFLESFILMAS